MEKAIKKIESRVQRIVEKINECEDDRESLEEIQRKIKDAMEIIKNSSQHDIEEVIQATYDLGELMGKAVMSYKMSKISKILVSL